VVVLMHALPNVITPRVLFVVGHCDTFRHKQNRSKYVSLYGVRDSLNFSIDNINHFNGAS
jgi:hypothetical protein